MADMILRTEGLSAGYSGKVIANDVSFGVPAGEIVSLIGPNGSGKTTILRTCTGLIEPIAGAVYLDGRVLSEIPRRETARIMAVMMTERMAAEQLTVRDVVSLGRFPYTGILGRLADDDMQIVEAALARVDMLELSERIYNSLSDGQKQRALLARAICQQPRIMILDEPTSYLDIYHKLKFIDILKDLAAADGISVLMSVHELEIAYEISDRVVCLGRDGRIKAFGAPQDVFSEEIVDGLYDLEAGRMEKMYGGFLEAIKGRPEAAAPDEGGALDG